MGEQFAVGLRGRARQGHQPDSHQRELWRAHSPWAATNKGMLAVEENILAGIVLYLLLHDFSNRSLIVVYNVRKTCVVLVPNCWGFVFTTSGEDFYHTEQN